MNQAPFCSWKYILKMSYLWSKTFLSWEIQTSLLEEKSFKWPSFIIRFQGFREIPSKYFAKFLTEFDELHFREKFSFTILFDICQYQPSISKTVELLHHKHPYFSTFSNKMAAKSLLFIIYSTVSNCRANLITVQRGNFAPQK